MATLTIDLDEATNQNLLALAAGRNQTPNALLQRAVEQYMATEMLQEQFRLETIAALEDYERTGLHLTDTEVSDWLQRRAAGEVVKLPACHV